MRKSRIMLLVGMSILAAIISSCGLPIATTKYGVAQNIVEAGVVRDSLLEDLANWCDDRPNVTMLWYPTVDLFSNRGIEGVSNTDKRVFLNNEVASGYSTDNELATTKQQILNSVKPVTDLYGDLKLKLEPKDLLGTTWDLFIGVGSEQKTIVETPNSGYVLVQFIDENGIYRVTNAEREKDWNNLTVPKNIPREQLKGYAFFKIEDGEVKAALVILP